MYVWYQISTTKKCSIKYWKLCFDFWEFFILKTFSNVFFPKKGFCNVILCLGFFYHKFPPSHWKNRKLISKAPKRYSKVHLHNICGKWILRWFGENNEPNFFFFFINESTIYSSSSNKNKFEKHLQTSMKHYSRLTPFYLNRVFLPTAPYSGLQILSHGYCPHIPKTNLPISVPH